MKIIRGRSLKIALILPFLAVSSIAVAGAQEDIPHVDGDIGTCSALFTVRDGSQKPIYNAKVDVSIHYGFMNKRKTDLEVATNADGKARVDGLPNFPRKPLDFVVHSGTVSEQVTDDPSATCDAKFDVTLRVR
ncbi:MAG TPA: hypothetical protein VMF66_19040 [Candidatus Acidoferrum sp.]|nr:hypothetical protein [Candidatus Acidoferrum sp.]